MKVFVTRIILSVIILTPSSLLAESMDDLKFGFHADRLVVSRNTIVFQDSLSRKIEKIGTKLTRSSGKSLGNYVFRVMNDPIINAYSAAGGYIYVNTGLLDILENEDELAFILAHEIAHTNQDHQKNFLISAHRKMVAGKALGALLGAALGGGLAMATGAALSGSMYAGQIAGQVGNLGYQTGQLLGLGMGVSMIKGYGKEQELQADDLAIDTLYRAGYDPEASISVFKKLAAIRDKLGTNRENYRSNLINSEPGLEQRRTQALEKLAKQGKKPEAAQK